MRAATRYVAMISGLLLLTSCSDGAKPPARDAFAAYSTRQLCALVVAPHEQLDEAAPSTIGTIEARYSRFFEFLGASSPSTAAWRNLLPSTRAAVCSVRSDGAAVVRVIDAANGATLTIPTVAY